MKKYFLFSILSLFLLSSFFPLCALASESDGTLDESFNIGTGFASNNTVNVLVRQPDGKIIVGGSFTSYNGTTTNRIVRLNADGSRDETFTIGNGISGGATPGVFSFLLQPDGKLLVGGSFNTYGSASSTMLVRLNTDGTYDNTFTSLFSGISNVLAFARQPDGKIIVAGNFSMYGGTSANRIVRINADGSRDTSFTMGTGFNSTSIDALALQSDGKIVVGGNFTGYNGTAVSDIVRLNADGSIDGSFNPGGAGFSGTVLNGIVRTLALDDEGRIIAGGDFTSYNGTPINKIVRLNMDGSIDGTFTPSGTGFDNTSVRAIAIEDDGKILLGGTFLSFNGTTTNRIIRLNQNGSRDETFIIGNGFNNTLLALLIDPDDKILAGGVFTSYNGTTTNGIARLGFSSPSPNNNSVQSTTSNTSSPAAPTCTDTSPIGVPNLFQVNANGSSATLYFGPLSGANTGYAVSYGPTISADSFATSFGLGNSSGVIPYTINELYPGTWYFKVRGQNGCMPGNWSGVVSTKVNGSSLTRVNSRVLGAATAASVSSGKCITYTVKARDTLWDIASQRLGKGVKYSEIMTSNNLSTINLQIGQNIKIGC